MKLQALSSIEPIAVDALLDAAFGANRKGRTAYMLRDGVDFIDALSLGLVDGDKLIGSIQCWPVQIGKGTNACPLILVGPVAVDPAVQSKGHGHTLMHATLDAAATMDNPPMMMIGDEEYYGRFGFTAQATGGWTLPGPWEAHRLLCRNPAGHALPETGMVGPQLSS